MATPRLNLTEINTLLSSKHLFVNQGFRETEAICNSYFLDFATSDPVSPNKGNIYAVISPATGAFTGQENNIAIFDGFKWLFIPIVNGLKFYNVNADEYVAFDGTAWNKIVDLPYFLESLTTVNGRTNRTYGLNNTTTFNIPAGGNDGDRITLLDYAGTFGSSNLTLVPTGGNTIQDNVATSLTVTVAYSSFELIYLNNIWRVVSGVASGGVSTLAPGVYPLSTPGLDITKLTADFAVYIHDSTGNDSNDGLTPGTAFQTIERAFQELARYDLDIYNFTIFVDGVLSRTSSNQVNFPPYRSNGGKCILKRNTGTFSIFGFGTQAFTVGYLQRGDEWLLDGLVMSGTAANTQRFFKAYTPRGKFKVINTLSYDANQDIRVFEAVGLGTVEIEPGATINLVRINNHKAFMAGLNMGQVIVGDPDTNVSITTGGQFSFNTVGFFAAEFRSRAEVFATYSGTALTGSLRYTATKLSIVKRNNDPSGITTDVTADKGVIV